MHVCVLFYKVAHAKLEWFWQSKYAMISWVIEIQIAGLVVYHTF